MMSHFFNNLFLTLGFFRVLTELKGLDGAVLGSISRCLGSWGHYDTNLRGMIFFHLTRL